MDLRSSGRTIVQIQTVFQTDNLPWDDSTRNASGATPHDLIGHASQKQYEIIGVTVSEMIDAFGSASFDIADLVTQFTYICPDFNDSVLALDTRSYAVEFCAYVIYQIGPESRQVKKTTGDKTWRMRFIDHDKNNQMTVKTLFISTFKNGKAPERPQVHKLALSLTIKQASLLALIQLSLVNSLAVTLAPPVLLLTPLAGACFSRDDVVEISTHFGLPINQTLDIINSSCQSGGQHLPWSRMHCAAVAAINATRNMTDRKLRDSIISKVIKQYIAAKKQWEDNKYEYYSKFAHGGIPSHLSPTILIDAFEASQKAIVRALKQQHSSVTTLPSAPASGGAGAYSFPSFSPGQSQKPKSTPTSASSSPAQSPTVTRKPQATGATSKSKKP